MVDEENMGENGKNTLTPCQRGGERKREDDTIISDSIWYETILFGYIVFGVILSGETISG